MIRLTKRPKPAPLREKLYSDILDFCCKYFGTHILIKTNKNLKNKYIISSHTNTIQVIDGELEWGVDQNKESEIKYLTKDAQVPVINITINNESFNFINFFNYLFI